MIKKVEGAISEEDKLKLKKLTTELQDINEGNRKLHNVFGHSVLIPAMTMSFIWSIIFFIPCILKVIFVESAKVAWKATDELTKGLMRSRKKEKKREDEILKELEVIMDKIEQENKKEDDTRSEQTQPTNSSS